MSIVVNILLFFYIDSSTQRQIDKGLLIINNIKS
jgi:hypothetical protein